MSPKKYYHRAPPANAPEPTAANPAATDAKPSFLGLAQRLLWKPTPAPPKPPGPPPPGPPEETKAAAPAPEGAPPAKAPPPPAPATAPTMYAPPAPPPPKAKPRPKWLPASTAAPVPKLNRTHWGMLAAIVVLGLYLRLRDPLSSPIIGAEDPYLHMERTWNLAQGDPIHDYPPGLMVLLYPLTLFGTETFYQAARFLPPFIGAAAIVCTFALLRRYVHPAGALGAALLVATMREHIFRSTLLMPTTIDLALVPILLLAMLRASEGERWGLTTAGVLAVVLGVTHPWALGLLIVPLIAFWAILLANQKEARKWAVPVGAGGFLAFLIFTSGLATYSPTRLVKDHAFPRMMELTTNPASAFPLPIHVDLPEMVNWAAMVLAGAGAVVALRHRTRFGLLALLWTGLLLPIVLVDWFDIWYIPHRTVAYFAIGVAMLGGIAIAEAVRFLETTKPQARRTMAAGTLGVLLVLMLPAAFATQHWYRIYDENDMEAFRSLEENGKPFVVAGSWQTRAGYRGLTGAEAVYSPDFFENEVVRTFEVHKHPDLVVVVDNMTKENGHPTEFLDSWTLIGQWGDVRAYTRPPDTQ